MNFQLWKKFQEDSMTYLPCNILPWIWTWTHDSWNKFLYGSILNTCKLMLHLRYVHVSVLCMCTILILLQIYSVHIHICWILLITYVRKSCTGVFTIFFVYLLVWWFVFLLLLFFFVFCFFFFGGGCIFLFVILLLFFFTLLFQQWKKSCSLGENGIANFTIYDFFLSGCHWYLAVLFM
jgi:hypothetical protein